MAAYSMDETDWRIVEALQRDGRASWATLGRAVAMSPSAVSERVRRLEENGVITGYTAVVDHHAVGLGILAFVRLRYPSGHYKPFHDLMASTPQVVEAHHVTGEDCFVLKVVASSMKQLEDTTGRLSTLGAVTTNIVYSSPLTRRGLSPDAAGA
jgi:Lrp/AsnC family transcriptional regulator, leucine-responsive regulatory protein